MPKSYIYIMRFTILYILLCINCAQGQFDENFDDGDITQNPAWLGDIDNFKVNDDLQLQLDASEAGSSYIYTSVNLPDSFVMTLDIKLDFNPSGSNFGRIYFGQTSNNPSVSNGYYLQLGENGGNDAVELFEQRDGSTASLGRGIDGSVAQTRVDARILISRRQNILTVATDIGKTGNYIEAIRTSIDPLLLPSSSLIAIECIYTSTRVDKFFYDDIKIEEYTPDITPPELIEVLTSSNEEISLLFSEAIEANSINPLDIDIDNGIGQPLTATLNATNKNRIDCTLANPLNGIQAYQLSVQNVSDENGNIAANQTIEFSFADAPGPGDLLITEILFDPYREGSDFVELYNSSNKSISLENLRLYNADKDEDVFLPKIVITPEQYLALSENKAQLIDEYNPLSPDQIVEVNLPSFNNSDGNVSIDFGGSNWEETFDYEEDFHGSLIGDTEGVSLERISLVNPINVPSNWASASESVNFATPGYQNSNFLNSNLVNKGFELESKKMTPNGDGKEDQMRLLYKVDQPGYLMNLTIFNSSGYKIRNLSKNLTLGVEGVISWDGTDDDGNRANLGIYILSGEAFNTQGNTIPVQLSITLMDKI